MCILTRRARWKLGSFFGQNRNEVDLIYFASHQIFLGVGVGNTVKKNLPDCEAISGQLSIEDTDNPRLLAHSRVHGYLDSE